MTDYPIIRTDDDGRLDEFVARNVNVHFEAMGEAQFWIGIHDPATGRSWMLNCGAVSNRATGYAMCEEDV